MELDSKQSVELYISRVTDRTGTENDSENFDNFSGLFYWKWTEFYVCKYFKNFVLELETFLLGVMKFMYCTIKQRGWLTSKIFMMTC